MRTLLGLACVSLGAAVGCAGNPVANRGINDESKWVVSQIGRAPTSPQDAPEGASLPYQGAFQVHVAPSSQRGVSHDAEDRSDRPDLALYVRVGSQVVEVGEAHNAIALQSEFPISLRRGETVEMRLVDRRTSGVSWRYDSKTTDDWARAHTREVPLAQFSFIFEGPGRYFFHQGYGLFFVDLKRLS